MGAQGTTTVNFGAFPGGSDAAVVVTGQTAITGTSLVEAWLFPAATADHTADEHVVESIKVMAGNVSPGVGFTVYAVNTSTLNEPLTPTGVACARPAASSVYGFSAPSVGGMGTRLYGQFSIGWVWN